MPIFPKLFTSSEKEKPSSSDPDSKELDLPIPKLSEKATTNDPPKTPQSSAQTRRVQTYHTQFPVFPAPGYQFRAPYYPSNGDHARTPLLVAACPYCPDFVRKNDTILLDDFKDLLQSFLSDQLLPLLTETQEEIARQGSLVLEYIGKSRAQETSGIRSEEVEVPSYPVTRSHSPREIRHNNHTADPQLTDPLRGLYPDPEERAYHSYLKASNLLMGSAHLSVSVPCNKRIGSRCPAPSNYITFHQLLRPEQIKQCVRSCVTSVLSAELTKIKYELERQNMMLESMNLNGDLEEGRSPPLYASFQDKVSGESPQVQDQVETRENTNHVPTSGNMGGTSPASSHNRNSIDEGRKALVAELVSLSQNEFDKLPQCIKELTLKVQSLSSVEP
ncbi:hypothetical protein NP233_g1035 [Leucocoprinus birnbaumii]|uniref:Uncharacterized protein n=1 Tax=Leucocoprinus birnbaumii TaxID=56174 RepID=A0AAD5W141_9AGAR|nr:hypothetical protein NP233_g1035 [Leucocoprinus birnbaumii]